MRILKLLSYFTFILIFCGFASTDPFKYFNEIIEKEKKIGREKNYTKHNEFTHNELPEKLNKFFNESSSKDIARLNTKTLHSLFKVSELAFFYNRNFNFWNYQDMIFQLLKKTNTLTNKEIAQTYENAVTMRQYARAKQISNKYKSIKLKPYPAPIEDPSTINKNHKYYAISRDGEQMRLGFYARKETEIWVYGHPYCGFSKKLSDYVNRNPKIKQIFEKYSFWILDPDAWEYTRTIASYNQTHPEINFFLAYSYSDWPELDFSSIPRIYFFKNRNEVYRIIGWEGNGKSVEDMRTGLKKLGLFF